jgi:hypothetical protein
MSAMRRVCGRLLSTTATSLEKRLTMRPEGVVSKKLMGLLRMLVNMDWWRWPAAVTILAEAMTEYTSTRMAGNKTRRRRNKFK